MPSKVAYWPVRFHVGVFDVHAGYVVGQQHDLVAVEFVGVLVGQAGGLDLLHDAGDEVAGAGEGVEDVGHPRRRGSCRTPV